VDLTSYKPIRKVYPGLHAKVYAMLLQNTICLGLELAHCAR